MFVEIDDTRTAARREDIAVTVTSDAGAVVFRAEQQRASSELGGKRRLRHSAPGPLAALPPGPEVLTVEARSRLGNGEAQSRRVVQVLPRAGGR